jgi:hypothetical protein
MKKLAATIAVTAGLSLAMMGTASAASLGHPKSHPKPKAVTQLTGKQLAKALLPGSAFGFGDTTHEEADTGKHLVSTHGSVSAFPCADLLGVPLAGQTAVAANSMASDGSDFGTQSISQFGSGSTAWWYYGQLKAKFNSCVSYSGTSKGSDQTGPLSLSIDLQSVSNTKVGSNSAFTVTQVVEVSDSFGDATESLNTTVVSSGRDVYTIWEMNTANTQIPNSLLSSLISRTQALYKG